MCVCVAVPTDDGRNSNMFNGARTTKSTRTIFFTKNIKAIIVVCADPFSLCPARWQSRVLSVVRSCSLLSFLLDVSVRTFRPKAPHVTVSSEDRPLLAVSGSLWEPAGVSSHVLWIACGRLPLRVHRGPGQCVAPVMCLTPSSYLSSWMSEIAMEPCPSCGSVADWRASVSAGPGSGIKSCSG